MWSETFLEDDKWKKVRDSLPKPIYNSWNKLSEGLKRKAVQKCAQTLMESESVDSSKTIDSFLRKVKNGEAFEPVKTVKDIYTDLPKPNPLSMHLIPAEKADPGLPGEIVIDEFGKLQNRYLAYTGFTKFLKDSYDEWLVNGLIPLIEDQVIEVRGGRIKFRNVSLTPPRIGGKKLYPRMAREKKITYGLSIHAHVVLEKDVGDEVVEEILGESTSKPKKHLGVVPLMLGSERCYLNGLLPYDLRAIGEDPSDPFGYFVVGGNEKIILMHEKLRLNRIFVTSRKRGKDKEAEASITIETPRGSVRVKLTIGRFKNISFETRFKAEINTPSSTKKTKAEEARDKRYAARAAAAAKKDGNYRYIGIEKLFYVLELYENADIYEDDDDVMGDDIDRWPEMMTDTIAQFTKPEWRNKIKSELAIMRLKYPNDKPEFVKREIATIKSGVAVGGPENVDKVVKNIIMNELFPNLNNLGRIDNIFKLKKNMLGLMVAKLIEVNLGLTPYDDRDSWANKRLETASRAMAQLMRGIWRKMVTSMKTALTDKSIDSIATIERELAKANITGIFKSSFNGTNWGVQGSMKTNMTQTPNRESVVALMSHLQRVEVDTNRNDKQPSIRMVHGTQWGYVCVTGDTRVSVDDCTTVPIKDLEDGDTVLTVSKDDLSETPSRIKNYFCVKPEKLLEITVINNNSIKCTPDHPFLLRNDKGENVWVKAGKLNVGDNVIIKMTNGSYKASSINKIASVDIEYVYDFETMHNNHSFIANGFVTHNCPVESPEGANCVERNTIVETPSGPRKIVDLKDGDEVITVDPLTHKRNVSEIYNHFTKEAEMFELKALGGFTVKATADHPFLAEGNVWKELGDLREGDKVYLQHTISAKSHDVDEEDVILKSIELTSMRSSLRTKINKELVDLGILPLKNNSAYLPILARMVGFSFGDASIHQSKTGSAIFTGFFGSDTDAEEFERDAEYLGFQVKVPKKRTNTRTMRDGRKINETVYTTVRGGSLCYLLMALGSPVGKKTRVPYNVPRWVKLGSDLVKREFLAGFQGADGGSPCWKKRKGKKNAYQINFGLTRKHKIASLLPNIVEFFEDMKMLYFDIGVNVGNNISVRKTYDDMYNVELQFSKSMDSIIDYAENIGYRYCRTKSQRLEKIYFYLKYKREKWNQRIELKKEISERHSKGEKPSDLAKEKCLTTRQVTGMLEQANKYTFPPRNLLNVDQFIEKYYDDHNGFFLPITSIVSVGNDLVCDFTTVSSEHSFIANGFVTHNCGIVKNLTTTAQVTYDKPDRIVIQEILDAKSDEDGEALFSIKPSPRYSSPVLVNGKFLGWCMGSQLRRHMILARRSQRIYIDTGVTLDTRNTLFVHTDTSRLVRPILVVEPVERDGKVTYEPLIKTKGLMGAPIKTLFEEGVIEYVDSFEVESKETFVAETFRSIKDPERAMDELLTTLAEHKKSLRIVQKSLKKDPDNEALINESKQIKVYIQSTQKSIDNIREQIPYSHVEMDPQSILGISASAIPYPNTNQGPRIAYQASMAKQALAIERAHHMACFDGKHKVLAFPNRPLFEPQINSILNLNAYPQGEMVWVAFNTYTGNTQEDAFVWNKASLDMGKFRIYKYNNIRVTYKSEGGQVERLQLPTSISPTQRNTTYEHINKNGLPTIGAHIKERQAVVGKVVIKGKEEIGNESVLLGYGEEGIVDKVIVTDNRAETIVKVSLRLFRTPIEGDKFAPRNAQKGTIGRIVPPEEMPYTEDGIIPDLIVDPHAMPSRMTMEYPMEIIAGVAGAITGRRINATAFREFTMAKFESVLKNYGYSEDGYHVMYSGKTGRKLKSKMFVGPVFFQALRHHVLDKGQVRNVGPYSGTTRQPVKGKPKKGGLRYGEMERDSTISHGVAYMGQERLCGVSDCYTAIYCKCGQVVASVNGAYRCKTCKDDAVFGEVKTTAALRLLNMFVAGFGFKQSFEFAKDEEQISQMVNEGQVHPREFEFELEEDEEY